MRYRRTPVAVSAGWRSIRRHRQKGGLALAIPLLVAAQGHAVSDPLKACADLF